MRRLWLLVAAILLAGVAWAQDKTQDKTQEKTPPAAPAAAQDTDKVPRISVDDLKKLMAKNKVVILDARAGPAWDSSDKKIKGAIRVSPADTQKQLPELEKYKKKQIVAYCT